MSRLLFVAVAFAVVALGSAANRTDGSASAPLCPGTACKQTVCCSTTKKCLPTGSTGFATTNTTTCSIASDCYCPTTETLYQVVSISDLSVAQWNAGVIVYNRGYGISIGTYAVATGWKSGCYVTSTALATRRAGIAVTFNAGLTGATAAAAKTAANGLTKAKLAADITKARVGTPGATAATPTITAIEAPKAISGGSSLSSGMIVGIVVAVAAVIVIGYFVWNHWHAHQRSLDHGPFSVSVKAEE